MTNLVPTDFSAGADIALHYAAVLAEAQHDDLLSVYIKPSVVLPRGDDDEDDDEDARIHQQAGRNREEPAHRSVSPSTAARKPAGRNSENCGHRKRWPDCVRNTRPDGFADDLDGSYRDCNWGKGKVCCINREAPSKY
jgi:hypothetical protein